MANAQDYMLRGSGIRVAGIDPPKTNLSAPTQKPFQQTPGPQGQATNAAIGQNVQSQFDVQKSTTEEVMQANVRGIQAEQDANQAVAQAAQNKANAVPTQSLFGQNLTTLGQTVNNYASARLQRDELQHKVNQDEQKRRDELAAQEAKAKQDQAATAATLEAETLALEAQALVEAAPEKGVQNAQQRFIQILSRHPNLDGATIRTLSTNFYNSLAALQQKHADRAHEAISQAQEAQTGQVNASIQLENQALLSKLKTQSDPTAVSEIIRNYMGATQRHIEEGNLTPVQAAQVRTVQLNAILKDHSVGADTRAKIQQALYDTQQFNKLAGEAQYKYDNGGMNLAQLDATLDVLRVKFNQPDSAKPVSEEEVRAAALRQKEQELAMNKAVEAGDINARNAEGFQRGEVGSAVLGIFNPNDANGAGQPLSYYQKRAAQGDLFAKEVINAHGLYKEVRDKKEGLRKEQQRIQLAINQEKLAEVEGANPRDRSANIAVLSDQMDDLQRQENNLNNQIAQWGLDRGSSGVAEVRAKYKSTGDKINQVRQQGNFE